MHQLAPTKPPSPPAGHYGPFPADSPRPTPAYHPLPTSLYDTSLLRTTRLPQPRPCRQPSTPRSHPAPTCRVRPRRTTGHAMPRRLASTVLYRPTGHILLLQAAPTSHADPPRPERMPTGHPGTITRRPVPTGRTASALHPLPTGQYDPSRTVSRRADLPKLPLAAPTSPAALFTGRILPDETCQRLPVPAWPPPTRPAWPERRPKPPSTRSASSPSLPVPTCHPNPMPNPADAPPRDSPERLATATQRTPLRADKPPPPRTLPRRY